MVNFRSLPVLFESISGNFRSISYHFWWNVDSFRSLPVNSGIFRSEVIASHLIAGGTREQWQSTNFQQWANINTVLARMYWANTLPMPGVYWIILGSVKHSMENFKVVTWIKVKLSCTWTRYSLSASYCHLIGNVSETGLRSKLIKARVLY